jgi:hypothetical protein
MWEAARISETSVDNYFTRQNIPEDNSELEANMFDGFPVKSDIATKKVTHFRAVGCLSYFKSA